MARIDDKQLPIARVYSRSMLQLAEAAGRADELLDELRALLDYLESDRDFARFLASPLVDPAERAATLEKAFRGRASDLLVDSLQVLNRKGRLPLLATIVESYRRSHQALRGRIDVRVATAVELVDAQRRELERAVAAYTGKAADLDERIDPSLVGGMVLEIGDRKIDASVARSLTALSAALVERGAREMRRGAAYLAGTAGRGEESP